MPHTPNVYILRHTLILFQFVVIPTSTLVHISISAIVSCSLWSQAYTCRVSHSCNSVHFNEFNFRKPDLNDNMSVVMCVICWINHLVSTCTPSNTRNCYWLPLSYGFIATTTSRFCYYLDNHLWNANYHLWIKYQNKKKLWNFTVLVTVQTWVMSSSTSHVVYCSPICTLSSDIIMFLFDV